MAARYAVTTGNWTGAIWAATSGGAAGSAAVPTNADGATIDKNVVVTIDDATAVCLSLTLSVGTTGADVGGKIQPSQAANSKITIQNQITSSGASGGSGAYSSTFAFDMSAVPSYTAEIVLNNANAAASTTTGANLAGNVTLVGAVKKRHTVIVGAMSAGATSCTVADATGWAVGDKLVFATTSAYNATPRTDEITIGTVNTGTGAITWTGGTTYAHADNCPVGNFTSNLIIRPGTAGGSAFVLVTTPTANASADIYVTDVEFRSQNAGTAQGSNPLGVNAANSRIKAISNNAFYDFRAGAIYIRSMATVVPRSNNIFYTTSASIIPCTTGQDVSGTATIGPDEDYAIFRCVLGLSAIFPEQHQTGHKISGITQSSSPAVGAIMVTKPGIQIENCSIWSSNSGISNTGTVIADTCTFGSDVFAGCDNTVSMQTGAGSIELTDCVFPASVGITGMSSTLPGSQVIVVNRDADPAVQEIYGSHSNTLPIISRVTSGYPAIGAIGPRSTSALQFESNAATAINYEIDIPAKASTAIKILVCVAKNAAYNNAAYTLPSATLSGLGITPVSASGTDVDDTWELLTLDLASGSAPTTDGVLTFTLSSASATAGAKAWFAGVTANPFVSRVRHYGYIFDETSPTRTVDLLTSASFATADAYTGMAITWGTSSSTAITTSNTFQKLFDYHQAKATQNVGSAVALTGAGTAGSPALFAAGNVTISDGAVLNGAGSISMSTFALATEFSYGVNYTYTGGAWSQLTTVPSFAGGTLNLGAAGTYTFTASSAILSLTPTAPSTYAMGGGTFSGTIDLRNTTAHAITVEVPSGTTTTTANNT
ncbi:MAG: hypothetical protein KBD60_14150, partial [Sterolibacterium sp.]|nr:hypothetical protein [Sterolibacterium sp.]